MSVFALVLAIFALLLIFALLMAPITAVSTLSHWSHTPGRFSNMGQLLHEELLYRAGGAVMASGFLLAAGGPFISLRLFPVVISTWLETLIVGGSFVTGVSMIILAGCFENYLLARKKSSGSTSDRNVSASKGDKP